ncbi:vWA domain-containing protein [Roseiconus lacunae]|uniref:VWA domain-containing protein n=1 Tax=Roseiconus lacunae TaxID=2605694 RepID=A0ABT7PDN5_9BACT|nr:vWA domain-containing protein [Roseiconus lacunae]MDM4014598.1 VWA domain-containing protein [Roseiconus lacunae]
MSFSQSDSTDLDSPEQKTLDSAAARPRSVNDSRSLAGHQGPSDAADGDVDAWSEEELEEEAVLQTDESAALFGSMAVHILIIVALAIMPTQLFEEEEAVVIVSPPVESETEPIIEEVVYSEIPELAPGANSTAEAEMAEASAEMFAEMAEIPSPVELEKSDLGDIEVNRIFSQPMAPMDRLVDRKGNVGEGTTGASGAVDRLTYEILQSMEERPTLVVWLFDQSGSLHRQRKEIRDRFDRIYDELGILGDSESSADDEIASKKPRGMNHDAQLLNSVIGFGEKITLYTETPTEDIAEIKSIVDQIETDTSGVERVFTAVKSAADEYKSLRVSRGGNGPQRNVLLIVVTDEKGDDDMHVEDAIGVCRKYGMPVHVIGVPAPFGRAETLVKYVDPDPEYDQTPRWASVDQGPESFMPERVQLPFTADFSQEPTIDSGFGPYALTRLSYETGGIYFNVHPNRNVARKVRRREVAAYASEMEYFFDPVAMSRYRPDYLSPRDYMTKVQSSPLRKSLVAAAQMKPTTGITKPRLEFLGVDQARLSTLLTQAQQQAARLEQPLVQMAFTLQPGMEFRDQEDSPRWKAGYDLAMGRVLAQKVRTETYNAMLAKAKLGMAFKEEKNNTWLLEPSDEVSVGSKWKREAETARMLLESVVSDHPGTPWALLASKELEVPIGWKWTEKFTDLSPPPQRRPGNNNNNPRPPRDDEKRMLEKKAPQRPIPKL